MVWRAQRLAQNVANQTYKNDQAIFTNLAPGKYDVVVVQECHAEGH